MIKNLLAVVAAAGLAVAPVAAQAGTRAAESGVTMDALASVERAGSPISTAEAAEDGMPVWVLLALFAGAGLAVLLAVEGGENNKSPGT